MRKNNGERTNSTKGSFEDEVDALFKLPLAEFTGARNALAARLKLAGRANDANLVKTLTKPSVTAWAVNQLYWNHREAFGKLLAAGERFRVAQTSSRAGKVADMRGSLNSRREALSDLSDLATSLLREAGHNPTADTVHRITTTLEALSSYTSLVEAPSLGRLTHDVDPPGFESLASLMSGAAPVKVNEELARVTPAKKSRVSTNAQSKSSPSSDVKKARQIEETRQARIAAAKDSLQDAKRLLTEARATTQRLEAAQKKAQAEAKRATMDAKQAEKDLRSAQQYFEEVSAASDDATERARAVAEDLAEAARSADAARRAVEKASKDLELLFRQP